MTNTILLKEIIKTSGLKKGKIAEFLGLSYGWLNKKINNEADFKAIEIAKLCELLGIDKKTRDKIFFVENVDK